MSPQLVDYDADGHMDLFMATFDGTPWVVRGSKEGYRGPEQVEDSQGRAVLLSAFWNYETDEWDNADRSPEGQRNPDDHCVSAVLFDWDGDGDLDLLLGAKEGHLYVQENQGTREAPSYTGVNERVQAGGKPLAVPGGMTAPRIVDWDGDGLDDLVCGSFEGGVYLFRNGGKPGEPGFEAAVQLLDPPERSTTDAKFPNQGTYADPVDYDGDGDLDLLVGGYSRWQPEQPELTEEQAARAVELESLVSRLDDQLDQLQSELWSKTEGLDEDEADKLWEELFESEKYVTLEEQLSAAREELDTLRPSSKRESFVWLYRRSSDA